MHKGIAATWAVVAAATAAVVTIAISATAATPPQDAPPAMAVAAAVPDDQQPRYTSSGELIPPTGYRDWVFLSSGYGMTYSASRSDHKMFTNVFVAPWAYRSFMQSGKWPDRTLFVLEARDSLGKGSIVAGGQFQGDTMGLDIEVKDEAHLPDKWAYFPYDGKAPSVRAQPKENCWQCHEDHAAVEHSFVQFYPTLQPVAKKFGTWRDR